MILSINAGSTSVKYRLFSSKLALVAGEDFPDTAPSKKLFHQIARLLESQLKQNRLKIAHRVVHGGPHLRHPMKITPYVIKTIKKHAHLAPLHNPFNLKAIEFARRYFPKAAHFAVFDTGFFRTLPLVAELYPIPLSFYKKYGIERYGFHGIAHAYCAEIAKQKLKLTRPNLITLHLGGGSSITAVKRARAIDTSMGYSPLEGLMMWSRAGDIDQGVLVSSTPKNFGAKFWNNVLNYESGLKGISGCRDYLDLLQKRALGHHTAKLAFDMFVYRIQKYIGAYYAALNGSVDAIVFSGKIGAGDAITRRAVCDGLPFLKNVAKLVVEPNEEWMMAKLVQKL